MMEWLKPVKLKRYEGNVCLVVFDRCHHVIYFQLGIKNLTRFVSSEILA